jgi:hypothetical protein
MRTLFGTQRLVESRTLMNQIRRKENHRICEIKSALRKHLGRWWTLFPIQGQPRASFAQLARSRPSGRGHPLCPTQEAEDPGRRRGDAGTMTPSLHKPKGRSTMRINRRASILVLLVGIASPIRSAPMVARGDYRGHESLIPGSIDGAPARQIPDEAARRIFAPHC